MNIQNDFVVKLYTLFSIPLILMITYNSFLKISILFGAVRIFLYIMGLKDIVHKTEKGGHSMGVLYFSFSFAAKFKIIYFYFTVFSTKLPVSEASSPTAVCRTNKTLSSPIFCQTCLNYGHGGWGLTIRI